MLSIYLEYNIILNDKAGYINQLNDTLGYSYLLNNAAFYKVVLKDTLDYLGAIGGFLAGFGTIIAAGAAAVGVDNWVKQLKSTRVLDAIWDSQEALNKINSQFLFWQMLKNIDTEKNIENIKNIEDMFFDEFLNLGTACCVLDALKGQSKKPRTQFYWRCRFKYLQKLYTATKESLENQKPTNTKFKSCYDNLLIDLDKFEKEQT
jgi:hypothetical protein